MTAALPGHHLYLGDQRVPALVKEDKQAWPSLWGSPESMLTDVAAINYSPGDYNLGARFLVTADGRITHFHYWHTGGCPGGTVHTLALWTSDRVQRVAVPDPGPFEGGSVWRTVELSEPYFVTAGQEYIASLTTNNAWYAWSPAVVSISPHMINLQGMYSQGAAFPETPAGDGHYHIDVVYQPAGGG